MGREFAHVCVPVNKKRQAVSSCGSPTAPAAQVAPRASPTPRDTQAARPHLLRTVAPAGGRGCGKPARAITSSAAIRARIRRPPERAASSRSWAWPEPLHARAKILRHTLRLRAGEGAGARPYRGRGSAAPCKSSLPLPPNNQNDSRLAQAARGCETREWSWVGPSSGGVHSTNSSSSPEVPPPPFWRWCCPPYPSLSSSYSGDCARDQSLQSADCAKALKVQKARERSPYPRAAAA